ncbi:MAG: hypothetical protein SFU25_05835 [Candidatus Caenarcaniphilales bacterium]|nr:hypothetical protein [Candidatus Caenarcaniphilales bacterium]
MTEIIFKVNLFVTIFMVGVIWFVQIVHYPLFAKVSPSVFPEYLAWHARLTTFVVAPMMLLELLTGIFMLLHQPLHQFGRIGRVVNILSFGLILLIWYSTFFIQVPLHDKLQGSWNQEIGARLVLTNWIRTVAWSLRGILLIWVL